MLFGGLLLLLSACGEGEVRFAAIDIKHARWSGEKILVAGDWAKGVSTPPLCRVLEGRDGPASDRFEPDARVVLDGNTFSKEFVPAEISREVPSAKKGGYYVRCTVSLDSGRTASDAVRAEPTL